MRTLLLMRHAKSGWDDPTLDDHERPINRRGTRDASRMARYMAGAGLIPDVVVCSDAVRTRATLTLLLAEWPGPAPAITYDANLYLAEPAGIMVAVGHLDAVAHRCLVLAHNPGIHALTLGLTGSGDRKAVAGVATRFPTSALAVIDLDVDDWKAIKPGSGRLRAFVYPKVL
jgi:phosphohistidine phosphatase